MESIISFTTILLLFYALLLLLIIHPVSARKIHTEFIYPNFTASYFQVIDDSGVFLTSLNGTFKASICSPFQKSSFYLCVVHAKSNTLIWTANRDAPISSSGYLNLAASGIYVHSDNGSVVWSVPALKSVVTALQLSDNGNLALLDRSNISIWQSFDYPTDTIVIGQRLAAGKELASSATGSDPSTGNYRLSVTNQDALLQWFGEQYWKLSMDTRAIQDSFAGVSYLQMNRTGLFLFSGNGAEVVWQVFLSAADFRYAKLNNRGSLQVYSFSAVAPTLEFSAPDGDCKLPFLCGRLGLCSGSSGPSCSCPPGFPSSDSQNGGCLPPGGYNLPMASCNSGSPFTFLQLGDGISYIGIDYATPVTTGSDLSSCQELCSKNCSCLGFFYANSSSCYLIKNRLGSVSTFFDRKDEDSTGMGYIKTVRKTTPSGSNAFNGGSNSGRHLPLFALILIPFTGTFVLIFLLLMGFLWWRRLRLSKTSAVQLGRPNSTSSDFDPILIPGLPVRFKYEELVAATDDFNTQIGSGGFGAVYKGVLPDKTVVAVKKITNIGVQGKKEFFTEIAVIGNIRYVNLVRLRGFCAEGMQRLPVYEYMNRGSLDRSLFGVGSVLEWQERVDIALGTARGLAYLHSGCDQKIIHCDVKPENILLHDNLQVKISDFGLSKLISPEQSNFFTTMRGTRGYLAPEWLTNSAISDRTDVYSYGMVLLEIIRGRKNYSVRGQNPNVDEESGIRSSSSVSGTIYFPLFALEMHEQGRYLELADPRLEGRVTSNEVERLVRIALCCVHEEPMLRPNMMNVVAMLEGGIGLIEPRVESLNFLRFYGRRFTEPSMLDENAENGFMYRMGNNSLPTTSSSGTRTSISYLSSQVLSGPR